MRGMRTARRNPSVPYQWNCDTGLGYPPTPAPPPSASNPNDPLWMRLVEPFAQAGAYRLAGSPFYGSGFSAQFPGQYPGGYGFGQPFAGAASGLSTYLPFILIGGVALLAMRK